MEVLELVLRRDGTVKSFKSDFKIYRGSYGDVLFNMSVPHELLVDQVRDIDTNDIITGNYVAVSAIIRTVVGKNLQTKKYYFKAVKDYEMHGTTHRLYQRKLPKEFTLWETVNQHEAIGGGLLEMIVNVVNFTTDDEKSRIEEIVASPILTLDIYPSDKLDEEEEIEPSEFEALHSQVEDLQLDYNNTHSKADEALIVANSANIKSSEAVNTAGSALAIAEGIENKADQALHDASNAVDTANDAHDLAASVDSKATEALQTANHALAEANSASYTAYNAEQVANQAYGTASDAYGIAWQAEGTANTAYQTADNAGQVADEAKQIAIDAEQTAQDAYSIASNASRAIALDDDTAMYNYISNAINKGKHNVGDAIYLKQTDVPDYWITEVLDIPNASGYYYEIEPLESKLPDITNMVTTDTNQSISGNKNFTGDLKKNGVNVATIDDLSSKVDKITGKGLSTNDYTNTDKDKVANSVLTIPQTLTEEQKLQARQNIGAVGGGGAEISPNGIDYLKDPDKTYLVIKTPADNDTFTLLTGYNSSSNYTIEWGDGSSDDIAGSSYPTHTYEKAGMYLITISGDFANGVVFGTDANVDKDKIIEVYGGTNYPTSLGITAFNKCSNLISVTFPNITSIGLGSFYQCTSLIKVTIPKATSISNDAFNGCSSLATAIFPNATSIANGAFNSCTSLKTLTLGNVTTTTTGTRFANVKLVNLIIAQDVTSDDIDRIKQLYANNGGTFTGAQINSI